MSSTLARARAAAVKVLAATPGTPTMPRPPTVMSETSLMAVIALTPRAVGWPVAVIFVPGSSGAKLLRIQTGMPLSATGLSVFGCSTFAPK